MICRLFCCPQGTNNFASVVLDKHINLHVEEKLENLNASATVKSPGIKIRSEVDTSLPPMERVPTLP